MKVLSYNISIQALFIGGVDFVCAVAAVFASVLIVNGQDFGIQSITTTHYLFSGPLYALLVVLGLGAMGLYDSRQRYGLAGAFVRMLLGVCLAALAMLVIGFLFDLVDARLIWGLAFVFSVALLALARVAFDRVMDDEVFRRRVLVYGAGERASRILELRRRSDQRGFRIIAFVPASGDSSRMNDLRVVESMPGTLLEYAHEHNINEIVVAMDDRRKGFPVAELLACKLSGIRITDLLDFLERESGRVKVDIMNPSWLIFSESFNRRSRDRVSFKLLDMAIGGVVLVLASPIMFLVAILILLDDGSPVLYRQERVGFGGRHFTLYKFRSMRNDAEKAGEAVWAAVDDPRVTRVGDWLRKLRLDELPQLFNVMKGEMSIVGPRPERPQFVEDLAQNIPYYHERHYVKPGITGWAQLCYPYGSSESDALAKLEFDLYYIKNRSLIFYLMILLQTAEVVLWRKGSR